MGSPQPPLKNIQKVLKCLYLLYVCSISIAPWNKNRQTVDCAGTETFGLESVILPSRFEQTAFSLKKKNGRFKAKTFPSYLLYLDLFQYRCKP